MKKIIFLIVFLVSACDASEKDKVRLFADNIKNIVASEEKVEFKKIPVFPKMSISDEAIGYVFGDGGGGSGFVKFFRKNIVIKIYGPYVRNDSYNNHSYSIVYYDPNKINPSETGNFDPALIKKYWGIAFLETVVTIYDGVVMFHRTPFYFGSHAPWAEDY